MLIFKLSRKFLRLNQAWKPLFCNFSNCLSWFSNLCFYFLFLKDPQSLLILFPCICACVLSRFSHAHQAPLSRRFSRQEYWNGLSFPPPGDLPDPGMEPASLTSLVLARRFFTTGATWEALIPYHLLNLCALYTPVHTVQASWLHLNHCNHRWTRICLPSKPLT